ncbi:hypothetical protein RHGRI_021300 [Rhododendron griersonianum]|uniref:Uncharacterized protein n=2 Tax=Rhododendron griersonianum TaxID=479676 RepID=A0AAV6JNN7_9ERIC|nr:hypothetical protein RHGRI_021300 [Rhododendron griersonianum]
MPLLCKLCGRFRKLTIGPWWPKSKKRGSFRDPGNNIKAVPSPGSPFTLMLGVVLPLVVAKVLLPGLVLKTERIRLQHPLKISLNPVLRGLEVNSKVGALSASSVGNRVTSLRIVVRLPEVVTRHFSLRRLWNKVVRMIFPFMMKKYVKKLGVMMRRKKAMRWMLVMKIGCVPISFTPLAMLAVEFAT